MYFAGKCLLLTSMVITCLCRWAQRCHPEHRLRMATAMYCDLCHVCTLMFLLHKRLARCNTAEVSGAYEIAFVLQWSCTAS